jgi:catechol 2,3-dioxygenase-like lactoylglutathione lyase family enzyme
MKIYNMKLFVKFLFTYFLVSQLPVGVAAQVSKVEAIGITVKDMDRSVTFYTQVLGFKKISDMELSGESQEKLQDLFGLRMRIVRLQLGEEFVELTDYLTSGGRSIPEDTKSNDLVFQHIAIVVSDMEKAYRQIRKYQVEHVSTAPQTLPPSIPAAAGIKAFYFHDPDQHNLELIYFPIGKGAPKWQTSKRALFLGIDHTAIVVSNTEKSHYFYSNLLGLERKGDSWNIGTEQAHLNNVSDASLHITGYRAPEGPGVEFLQYLIPGPGKQYPTDSKTNDIWHWHTILFTNDAAALYSKLKAANTVFVSKGIVDSYSNGVPVKSFMARDPDGHACMVVERQQRRK